MTKTLFAAIFHYPSLAGVGLILAALSYAALAPLAQAAPPTIVIVQATPALAQVAPTAAPIALEQATPETKIIYVDRVVEVPAPAAAAPATYAPPVEQEAPPATDTLNDPATNGGSTAAPGCPFPVVNGVCGNGAPAAPAEEGAQEGTHAGRRLPDKPDCLPNGVCIVPTAARP